MGDVTCTKPGCGKPHKAHGLCENHYMHWWRSRRPPRRTARCRVVAGCAKPVFSPGACQEHYIQKTNERFWAKVNKDGPISARRLDLGPCWVWTRSTSDGYGRFSVRGVPCQAHRYSYELLVGSIPENLQLDHLCHNRACVNPSHLEPVPQPINIQRGDAPNIRYAREGVCQRGHSEDSYVSPSGRRMCAVCAEDRQLTARLDEAHQQHRVNRRPNARFRQLTVTQVADIKALLAEQALSNREIAVRVGCSPATVWAIRTGRRKGSRNVLT